MYAVLAGTVVTGVFLKVLIQNIVAKIRKTDPEENQKEKVTEKSGGNYEKELF